jgi:uncharacterized membrane protein YcaP (DUF421 family)
MREFFQDSAIVIIRLITILPLTLFVALYMGKRAIGELPVFDFLIVLILGSIVGADIADPNIKHLPTAVAIVSIGLLQRFVSSVKISHRKLGKLITFEPTVVIQEGQFLNKNLKQVGYSIDNVLQMLREKDIFDVCEVEAAFIEPAGTLSVLKKADSQPVTLKDLKIKRRSSSIAYPVILEGMIEVRVLEYFKLDETWLYEQLTFQKVTDINSVFFASLNTNLELHISLKDKTPVPVLPVQH